MQRTVLASASMGSAANLRRPGAECAGALPLLPRRTATDGCEMTTNAPMVLETADVMDDLRQGSHPWATNGIAWRMAPGRQTAPSDMQRVRRPRPPTCARSHSLRTQSRLAARRPLSYPTSRDHGNVTTALSLSYEQGGALNLQDQLTTEGVTGLMQALPSMMLLVTVSKDHQMMPVCIACILCALTMTKGPLLAAFACLVAPNGVGMPTGALGALRESSVGKIAGARVVLAVSI